MDYIKKLIIDHILIMSSVTAALVALVAKLDSVILFLLRFVSKDVLEAKLDQLNAIAKAEVEKEAAIMNAPKPAPAPDAPKP